MTTQTTRWTTFAAILLATLCSTDLTQAGDHKSNGKHSNSGNFQHKNSQFNSSMFRNNSQKYSHNNNSNNSSNSSNKQYVYKKFVRSTPNFNANTQIGTPKFIDTPHNHQNNHSNHKQLSNFFDNQQFHSNQSHQHGNNLGVNPQNLTGKFSGNTFGQHHHDGDHHDHHDHHGHHHHNNWCWVGFATPWVYGANNYRYGGYYTPTVINNTTVIEQPVVQTSATVPATSTLATGVTAQTANALDLTLKNISLVDAGSIAAGTGPTYRVVIGNASKVDVAQPFTVTMIAAKPDRSFDENTPRVDQQVDTLPANTDKTLDIRLPVAALTSEKDTAGNEAPFSTLLVVIDGFAKLTEANRDNNAAAIPRTEVEANSPTVTSAQTVAANGYREVNVTGQSFGNEPGKLMIDLGTVRVPAEVVSWNANSIKAKLPNIETAASVTTNLLIVRADGVNAQPFDLTVKGVAVK